jgi:hypothetical protein
LVVAGLCTDLDRWILLPKDLRGVVRQVGNGLVVAGEAAQIVTVGFVAEDLERERVGQLVGGRIDLDRWIC